MLYSKKDLYPNMSGALPTPDQTIPDNSVTTEHPDSKQKVTVNKNMIFGAIGLLVCVMVLMHYVK